MLGSLLYTLIMDVIMVDISEGAPWSMLFADVVAIYAEKREHPEKILRD